LLLCRTSSGLDDRLGYADALYLLERGADPNRAAADGMTFAKMLTQHRAHFTAGKRAPPEFEALWDWAEKHGHRPLITVTLDGIRFAEVELLKVLY
jgi:hypothetical protein